MPESNDLFLQEAAQLNRFLADPAGESAIRKFFEKQMNYQKQRCMEEMLKGDEVSSRKAAFMAHAFEAALPELKNFVKNQIEAHGYQDI